MEKYDGPKQCINFFYVVATQQYIQLALKWEKKRKKTRLLSNYNKKTCWAILEFPTLHSGPKWKRMPE